MKKAKKKLGKLRVGMKVRVKKYYIENPGSFQYGYTDVMLEDIKRNKGIGKIEPFGCVNVAFKGGHRDWIFANHEVMPLRKRRKK